MIPLTGTGGQWPPTLSITGGTSYLNDRAYVIVWQSDPAPRRHFEQHRESRPLARRRGCPTTPHLLARADLTTGRPRAPLGRERWEP